jgi:hypothetical protein
MFKIVQNFSILRGKTWRKQFPVYFEDTQTLKIGLKLLEFFFFFFGFVERI